MTKQGTLFDDLPAYLGPVHRHPLYSVWKDMRWRCHNPKAKCFSNYGGRGIFVCDEWRYSARSFVSWAINAGWQRGLFIDRKDNDGPYSPGNCRFVTRRQNQNNRRNTVRSSDGVPVAELARRSGLGIKTVRQRVARGLPPQEVVAPVAPRVSRCLPDGTPLAAAPRAEGVSLQTVYRRLNDGWSLADALSKPLHHAPRLVSSGVSALDAGRAAGIKPSTVATRITRGWSADAAASVPVSRECLPDGRPLADAARAAGLAPNTLRNRLLGGWSVHDALSVPKGGKRPAATAAVALGESEASAQGEEAQRPAIPAGLRDLPAVDLPCPIFDPGYPASFREGIEND